MTSPAKDVAQAIVKSGLWGDANPNTVLMLCYLAEAEGNHPAVVYRDYHIMSGKPSKKAEAILRDFIEGGGKIEWHALDDACADATFSHPSGSARIKWDMARAQKAGVGRNPMWKKYPRQMLRSRCISEGVRTVYPGATSGLYEENEVADIAADEAPQQQEGQSQGDDQGAVDPPVGKNWGGRYPTKTALKKAMHEHHAELRRIGDEATHDDLEGYISSPEYQDYVATAGIHANIYLEGGEGAPEGFEGAFALEQRARDLIALRGNNPITKPQEEPA